MNILHVLENVVVYVSEAAARIFSPSDNTYPMIGVQPFDGIPYHGSEWED
ncbi:MAG: isochorismate synthase [Lyngbya sp.]|nr:isochorismate synthase [Lyngbya sp.]